MNEAIFFLHIFSVIGITLMVSRMGRHALISFIVLQPILANFFVIKQMSLFGFSVTCSDVFAIGGILGLNLLQENYGRPEANKAIKMAFFALLFFMAMSQIHLWYQPIPQDETQQAFSLILSNTPRIALSSLGVYFLVQKLDLRLFGWLQLLFRGKYLPFRIGISLVVTQLLDTILFSILGLYGLVASLWDVIVVSFLIKCLIISCSSFLVALSRRLEKHVPI